MDQREDTIAYELPKIDPKEILKTQIIKAFIKKDFTNLCCLTKTVLFIKIVDSIVVNKQKRADYGAIWELNDIIKGIQFDFLDTNIAETELGYILMVFVQNKYMFLFLLDENNNICKIAYKIRS